MKRRDVDKHKYLAAFAISTLIFFAGISLGSFFSNQKVSVIDSLARNIQMSTLGTELQYDIISEKPCNAINSSKLADELYQIGSRLDFMEGELGTDDDRVLSLKEYYHLLEIRHWLFLKKVGTECEKQYDLILYFYSNKGDCPKCDEEGAVLTYLHRKYPDLNIYSFDINIDNPALDTIKSIYGVTGAPSLIVNEELLEGFRNRIALEESLFNTSLISS